MIQYCIRAQLHVYHHVQGAAAVIRALELFYQLQSGAFAQQQENTEVVDRRPRFAGQCPAQQHRAGIHLLVNVNHQALVQRSSIERGESLRGSADIDRLDVFSQQGFVSLQAFGERKNGHPRPVAALVPHQHPIVYPDLVVGLIEQGSWKYGVREPFPVKASLCSLAFLQEMVL